MPPYSQTTPPRITPKQVALNVHKKAEIFRRQTGNLDLIVNMYNHIQTTLLPVERPLVRSHLDRMDKTLKRGLESIRWKSHGVDAFINDCMGSSELFDFSLVPDLRPCNLNNPPTHPSSQSPSSMALWRA